MKSLGKQFEDIMKPRVADRDKFGEVAKETGQQLVEGAQSRTRKGETVPHGRYNNTYAPSTAKKKGRSSPVTLRDKEHSIRNMRANKYGGQKARIRGSRKMWLHDRGKAKGGKRRQLFPDTPKQIPRGLIDFMKRQIKLILSGNK